LSYIKMTAGSGLEQPSYSDSKEHNSDHSGSSAADIVRGPFVIDPRYAT